MIKMTNLLIDAGNSSIKTAVSRDNIIFDENRCKIEDLKDILECYIKKYKKFDVVAVSDVKGLPESIYLYMSVYCKKLVRVKDGVKLPIVNKYSTPKTLGADRLCAAVGASMVLPNKNCVIVDFGTAITFDFLTSEGEFLGGNISVGLGTRFKSLNHYTGKLPLVKRTNTIDRIGNSTISAIESGVIQGTIFEIEGYLKLYPEHSFIFTGGDAIFFAEKVKSPIFVVCNLVLMGLSLIAKINAV